VKLKREKIVEKSRVSTIVVADGSIQAVRSNDDVETGLRLFDGEHIAVAGALGEFDPADLEARAQRALELQIPYPFEPSAGLKRTVELPAGLTDLGEALDELETLLTGLRSSKDFSFSGKMKLIDQEFHLSNDQGLDLQARVACAVVGILFKEANSGSVMDGHVSHVGRDYDGSAFLAHAHEVLEAYRRPVALPVGEKLPVVRVASAGGMDAPYGFFARALNARAFATGASALAKYHGEMAFSPDFTLWQSRDSENTLGPFFDAEGVVNVGDRYALIENGRVITPYSDKKSAADFNLPLTGAAGAYYDGMPSLAQPAFEAAATVQNVKELLAGEPGVLVWISSGGDYTPDGHYAAPVQLAFLFDGERLLGRLPQVRISSTVFDIFGDDYLGIARDPWPAFARERLLVTRMQVTPLG
jgi:PmbA protein